MTNEQAARETGETDPDMLAMHREIMREDPAVANTLGAVVDAPAVVAGAPTTAPETIKGRVVEYWDVDVDVETLRHTDISEALYAWIDEMDEGEAVPETVDVFGFARMQGPTAASLAGDLLEHALEILDDRYELADPNQHENTKPTSAMDMAAMTLAEAVLKDYVPWACEQVTQRTVVVREYVNAL